MSDTQFADGMNVYKPGERAPEFIIANLVFHVTDFTNWLNSHATPEGKVRVVVKESKGGKYYAQLDQYTAKSDDSGPHDYPAEPKDSIDPDSIPF